MNVFQLAADMCHLFAVLLLLVKILKTRSCAGISGKSQLLYLIVFLSRYLDLFTVFISYYLTSMKVIFISLTALTVLLIFVIYKSTYDSEHDTFNIAALLLPAAALAFYINHEFYFLEVMWTFSIYLEAVAIVPQFVMTHKKGEVEMFLVHYLFALGLYRGLYIFKWVYRYRHEHYFDSITYLSGCVQTALYCYFLFTKDFLKRMAHAYHCLQANRKVWAELEKGGEQTVVEGLEGGAEDKEHLSLQQLNSIAVPSQENTNVNAMHLEPQESVNDAAPPCVAGSSGEGSHDWGNRFSAAAGGAPLGAEARHSPV
ncbi:hypothetical protein ACOMHN_031587 [Nucella lapillus]